MTAIKRPRPGDMRAYVENGLQLIPLHRYDAVDGKGRPRGKTPRDGAWQAKEYDSRAVIENADRQGVNVGVRLPANIMVLDVDPRNFPEGRDSLAELVADMSLDLSVAPHTVTGSGGHHYWFTKPVDVDLLDSLEDYQGIEFKSRGRQVVAAGSVHPNGTHYEWDDLAPGLDEMPEMPANLMRLCRRPTRAHGEAAGLGELTPEMLASTLEQLEAEDFADHDRWRDLMMACHHATNGEGRQEFIEWSTQDVKYQDDAWIIGRRWDSLHATSGRGGRPVTIKFLHKVVQEGGGEVTRVDAADDFDVWEDPDDLGQGVDDEELRAEPKSEGVMGILEDMNETHCVVMEGGKFRIFTEKMDPVLKRPFFQRSTKEDFENLYCNQLVEMHDKLVTKSSLWIRSPHRRQYDGVIFDPEANHEGWLNLWRGWAVQPKKGDWSLLQELVRDVLCDGDKASYEYVLNWLAYMVQHPSQAAEVAMCFKGEKGTGKGTLGRAASFLAGSHGLQISSPEHLVGRFNSHLQNCICLFADEAFWAGDKSGEAKLKQLVTEPTIAYEGKGRDAVTGKNMIHIIMAANGDWVVPAGLDGERRFAVFQVNNSRRGDKAFFSRLNKQMYRDGGIEGMLFDLLARNINGWAPRDDVPSTSALVDQKVMTMDDVERWWYNKLLEGILPNARGDWHEGPVTVIKEHLRADYSDFAKDQRVYRPADPVSFGMRLNKLVSGKLENTQVKPGDEDYTVKVDRMGRASASKLPSLDDCRAMMEAKLGSKVQWPKDALD
ncbi:bifunctional DNA primase/polymerase [Xanthomonas phage vB_Xar_IVIA-DoCa6]|uniref:Bifunctional DNA primase/polymerase n=1 Tax=Xanthomonas phage vB_Xar_IVIA-DoCa6 TaxID=2975533 RepID=A0A9X9JN01_9CAUD|nr:bifunctional DNA primase/polymerase [Stenotrophomonas phage vB_SmaS-AXL_1]YP_010739127.1 bifunctional DNA primase/polymerase [Xanthomonas phage vB_Xar_IVIA-DoCa6]UIS24726.1 bifunctional DNA primase/polymerase [Stenotrophomonas phage vB_SmaS-AXL_1]UYA98821.1 bifunctional DNA primase/polymerase [Xanthomonas phage vB_Xar_IVIA-DoCa6]